MLRALGRHLTYANVTASLALFIALGGVSYAAVAIPRNSVGTKQIKRNAVTGVKVKNGSLRAGDFAAGQLPRGENGAPGAAGAQGATGPQGPKGDTGNVGPAGSIAGAPAGGDLTGTYPNPDIAGGAVGAAEIGNDAVTASELATDAAGLAEIATDAVGAAEILLNAVGAAEIATDAVAAAEIAADAVGAGEIATDAVGAAEIVLAGVGSDEIAQNAVTTDEIAGNTVAAGDIATDGVGAAEVATDAITSSEIDDGSIREQDVGTLTNGLRGNNIAVTSFQRSNVPIPSIPAGQCLPVNDDGGAGGPVLALPGDFVIPLRPVAFTDGLSLEPTVNDTDSRAVFEVCNRTGSPIDPPDTFDIGVLAIRPS